MARKLKSRPYDASEYLDSEEVIAEYLNAALEDPNLDVFLSAIGEVAKARGMTDIAKRTGLPRRSLYMALAPGAKPRYETVFKLLQGLGVKVVVRSRDDADNPSTKR